MVFPFRIAIIVYLVGILRKEKLSGENDTIVMFSGAVLCLYLIQAICIGTVELAHFGFKNDTYAEKKSRKKYVERRKMADGADSSSDYDKLIFP